jgi:hypothetical protein
VTVPRSICVRPARLFAAETFCVLGLPLRVESNSPRVLAIAREAFGAAAAPADGGARVHVEVRSGAAADEAGPVSHRVPRREVLLLSGRGCSGYADTARAEAVVEVAQALLDDASHFRSGVLEALALFLLARMDRDPLHAAAVARGGSALLLAGPSGVGKSTTVYAAARAGLRVLSEDAVFLQLDPFRAWGMPRRVHLLPETARFFPELGRVRPGRLFNGKTKLAVDLRGPGGSAGTPMAERAGVCLLARGSTPGVERLSADAAVAALTAAPEPGFDLYADSVGARIRRVAEQGAWRMTLPPHPADAVPMLHRMLDALE